MCQKVRDVKLHDSIVVWLHRMIALSVIELSSKGLKRNYITHGVLMFRDSSHEEGDTRAMDDMERFTIERTDDGPVLLAHWERMHRRSSRMATFPLLGWTGHAKQSMLAHWQTTGQGQRKPTGEPVVPILRGQAPQARFAGGMRCSSRTSRQWWRTMVMTRSNSEMTESEHMDHADQHESIQVESWFQPGLRPLGA